MFSKNLTNLIKLQFFIFFQKFPKLQLKSASILLNFQSLKVWRKFSIVSFFFFSSETELKKMEFGNKFQFYGFKSLVKMSNFLIKILICNIFIFPQSFSILKFL
jgi:hypothetical protein